MSIASIDAGVRGFDCNSRLTPKTAAVFKEHGYAFAIRYVPRLTPHDNDITPDEAGVIKAVGLGLMIVQHVESPGWIPTPEKGTAYGETAVEHCRAIGYAPGASVWLDVEEVARGVPTYAITGYCNRWYDVVRAAGYLPGVYVGWNCRLTPSELYWRLKFRAYWGAYNLNREQFPAVRGVQLLQREVRAGDVPMGVGIAFDVNIVSGDALGGFPIMDR